MSVAASCENGRLTIRVEDDGVGLRGRDPLNGGGIGLANIRARLAQLYGEEGDLRIGPATGGGTVIEVQMPFRTHPEHQTMDR